MSDRYSQALNLRSQGILDKHADRRRNKVELVELKSVHLPEMMQRTKAHLIQAFLNRPVRGKVSVRDKNTPSFKADLADADALS